MPIVRISMRAGKPVAYRQSIMDGLYQAMREALRVTEGNHFMTITEHDEANFRYGPAYGTRGPTPSSTFGSPYWTRAARRRNVTILAHRGIARREPRHSAGGHLHKSLGVGGRKLVRGNGAGSIRKGLAAGEDCPS